VYVDALPLYTDEQKVRIRGWTGEGIVRASIGLESPAGLIRDLNQALNARTFRGWAGSLAYQVIKGAKTQ
jgi:hypothetical protein